MPGTPAPALIAALAAAAAAKKARDKHAVETTAKQVKAGQKNGMGPGASVSKLTGGDVKTGARTGVATETNGFNPKDPRAVRDVQRFLKGRGYDVTVDGKWGPEVKSAYNAFTLHQSSGDNTRESASQWNISYKRANAQAVQAGKPAPFDANGNSTTTDPPANNGRGTQGAGGQADPFLSQLPGLLQSIAGLSSGNPDKMAAQEANAQFNPMIAEAQRQLGMATKAEGSHQTDLQSWFDNVIAQNKSGDQADTAALKGALGDSSGLLEHIMGSISDPNAKANIGKVALTNENNLKGIGLAQGNYNRNMDTALALTGRDQMNNQQQTDQSAIDTAKATLLGVIGQRGAALVSGRQSNRDTAIRNQTNLFNLLTTAGMLPSQMDSANIGNQLKLSEILKNSNPTTHPAKFNLKQLIDNAGYGIGVQNNRLPKGYDVGQAAHMVGIALKGAGLTPGSQDWHTIGSQILGSFQTADGKPIVVPNTYFSGADFR